jgi:ribonuclease HI
MAWDRVAVRAALLAAGLYAEEREIAHGVQFALDDGTRVNVYNTGKTLVQGKASPVKTQVQEILSATQAQAATAAKAEGAAAGVHAGRKVVMYTDGACIGNPGPGGWGVVLIHGAKERELSGGYRLTTNNRMELTAAIRGLEALREPSDVVLHSDSLYVVKGMREGWAVRWRANGWQRTKTAAAVNADLWARLLVLSETHRVTWEWVRGHAGHPENERVDRLANAAAQGDNLPADEPYERGEHGPLFMERT